MHDKTPVDVQNPLAHVYMLFQKDLDIIGWFQQENIWGVCDEHLKSRRYLWTDYIEEFLDFGYVRFIPAVSSELQHEHCIPTIHSQLPYWFPNKQIKTQDT